MSAMGACCTARRTLNSSRLMRQPQQPQQQMCACMQPAAEMHCKRIRTLWYISVGKQQVASITMTTPFAGSYSSRCSGYPRCCSGLSGPANRQSCYSSRVSIRGRPVVSGLAGACGAKTHSGRGTCSGMHHDHCTSLTLMCA